MTSDDREQKIRERAHRIWESEGGEHGRHDDHWHRAAGEIDAEHATPEVPLTEATPKKPAKRAPAAANPASEKAPKRPRATKAKPA